MKIQVLIVILVTLALITACGTQSNPAVEPEIFDTPTEVEPEVFDIPTEVQEDSFEPVEETLTPVETTPPNCLGDEINSIGQSIADEYEAASYEQVMTWFCNGAEFEDILVALETEMQTETPAVEMLQMLADDFTWEEIWQLVGLTD
jgi:hypothetical protein